MRVSMIVFMLLAVSTVGCTSLALERQVVQQAGTITDVRYHQVLDNLAMLAHNPSVMPYYALVTGGLAQIDDTVNASGALGWGWMGGVFSNSQSITPGAGRSKTGNWSLDPLHDPERIAAMRCVYQMVLGLDQQRCSDCHEIIHQFKLEPALAKMPPGWFHVGCKHDVPKDACYYAQYCDTYIWVMPDGVEGLTRLSLIVLDIATVDLDSLSPSKQVVTKYDGKCNRIGVEVTKNVDLNDPDCLTDNKGENKMLQETAPSANQSTTRRRDLTPSFRSLIGPVRR